MNLIVDGYNLMRSGTLPLSRTDVSEESRAELCELLSAYARARGFRLTVVFDGRRTGNTGRVRFPFKGGTGIFSSATESADDAIRDLASNAPQGTVAVTSDRGLAGTLGARKVTVVSCDEFAARLSARRMDEGKGCADEEPDRRPGKKGEGKRPKKKDRNRRKILGNL